MLLSQTPGLWISPPPIPLAHPGSQAPPPTTRLPLYCLPDRKSPLNTLMKALWFGWSLNISTVVDLKMHWGPQDFSRFL